ncbi:hypothetical protein V493_00807 [Pseudogymnoascus sp. VKM F-4281 (FW-2241)]|nr:hypothetical protein V493_00807 [Pseudogymnoascus sp. VKM F-4281 (FW-2241)]
MQADNGKEFKGALLLLLRKYGIQVVNRAPQTQGLVEQANGVVENKLQAWKMDHGSTEWKDGLLEVTLAINTQIHSTIGCALAELLFRDRSSHIDWLNSQARKDLSIGVEQEDPTMAPIFESELEPEALIDPQLCRAPELGIELSRSEPNSELSSGSEPEPELEPELNSRLRARLPARARAQAQAQLRRALELGIELSQSEPNSKLSSSSEPEPEPELEPELNSRLRARARAQLHQAPELGIESSHSEPELSIELELRRGSQARVPAQPRTELAADLVIEKAVAATQRARVSMIRKYTKKHDIQHFDIGAIVSIKVPREDRTSTDNKKA